MKGVKLSAIIRQLKRRQNKPKLPRRPAVTVGYKVGNTLWSCQYN